MENTVTISLDDYNELYDFKRRMELGSSFEIGYAGGIRYSIISTDEAVIKVCLVNEEQKKGLKELKQENISIKQENFDVLNKELLSLSEMGYFSFLKWKKKIKDRVHFGMNEK